VGSVSPAPVGAQMSRFSFVWYAAWKTLDWMRLRCFVPPKHDCTQQPRAGALSGHDAAAQQGPCCNAAHRAAWGGATCTQSSRDEIGTRSSCSFTGGVGGTDTSSQPLHSFLVVPSGSPTLQPHHIPSHGSGPSSPEKPGRPCEPTARRRCGGGEPSPGADVAGVSPKRGKGHLSRSTPAFLLSPIDSSLQQSAAGSTALDGACGGATHALAPQRAGRGAPRAGKERGERFSADRWLGCT
jgi:hypothetical protein